MKIDSISNISSNMVYAVNAVHLDMPQLSEELIRKLKELGIDPKTVKTEAEARALIAQAEKQQNINYVQPQGFNPNVDMKELHDDIKKFGDKFGVDVKTINSLKDIVDRFDVIVKEFKDASVQNKKIAVDIPVTDKDEKAVRMSTGVLVVDKPDTIDVEFKSIKERVEKVEQAKNAMYAGQDMLAMMNRIQLGI